MCDIVEMSASASAGSDPRRFRFAIRCCRCDLPFHTTHDAREHFTFACPRRTWPKIRCGCCGTVYRNWGRCASHLNVRGAHLRGPSSTVVVSSTTSSSEAESTTQEPSRRRHAATQPPQIKVETEAVTPPPAATGTPAPPTPFEVAASASVSPLPFTASDTSLSVPELDLSSDNPILQQLTTSASGAGVGQGLSVTSVIPPPPPSSTTLQIGAAPRGSADLWRNRFYILAQHALFWVQEAAESQVLHRLTLLPNWPDATNITSSLQPLAASLVQFYTQLADEDIEPQLL